VSAASGGASPPKRSPVVFFMLVYVLSLPFWAVGSLASFQLLPGLPVAALMFVCPVTAALILVYRENRTAGVKALLRRSLDFGRIQSKIWYAPMLLIMPGVMIGSFFAMRWTGIPVPAPQVSILSVLGLSLVFLVAGVCEELGWSGYATDPLQDRFTALQSALLLGVVWAVWHVVPYLKAHRSWEWIAWYSLFTVASRVLIVWIYDNTGGSVFAAAVFHATVNVTWQLFPISGSYFDPRVSGLLVAAAAVVVIVVWGPKTLTRHRPV